MYSFAFSLTNISAIKIRTIPIKSAHVGAKAGVNNTILHIPPFMAIYFQ
jgi:hypothetical protein